MPAATDSPLEPGLPEPLPTSTPDASTSEVLPPDVLAADALTEPAREAAPAPSAVPSPASSLTSSSAPDAPEALPSGFWDELSDTPPHALADVLFDAPPDELLDEPPQYRAAQAAPATTPLHHPRLKALQDIFPGRVLAVKQQSERRVTEETEGTGENAIDLSADLDDAQDDPQDEA